MKVGMDCFSVVALTEEVFSHLCNVALEKCHDKNERRKAGCGGQAMRKRVLIKNFVADLLRTQNERSSDDSSESGVSEGWEEEDIEMEQHIEDESDEEEEDDDVETTPLPSLTTSLERTFVDSDPSLSSLYPDYLEPSSDVVCLREGALGRADCKLSSEDRLWMYDVYGNESELAHTPLSSSAWSSTPSEWNTSYEGGLSDQDPLSPPSAIYDQNGYLDENAPTFGDALASSLFAQPVRAEAQDQLFLSLSTNHLAEMKTYAPEMALPEDLIAPGYSMTDLDAPAPCDENRPPQGCKRAVVDPSFYDSMNCQIAKRIKL